MAEYYLISQLPSLDGLSENVPMPITEERFFELCERFLNKKVQNELKKLTLMPSRECEETGSDFLNKWNEGERNLRLVLGKIRADKMNKAFDAEKIAFLPYHKIQDVFNQNDFNWNVPPSNHGTKEFLQLYTLVKDILTSQTLLFYFSEIRRET